MERLAGQLEAAVRARDAPMALVGYSRGGLFARVLAVRRPELVSTVVTLGSPHRDQLAVHPVAWATAFGLATTEKSGISAIARYGCGSGGCCRSFEADLLASLPRNVRLTSIYSRRDGIVDWRACLRKRQGTM